MAKESDLEVGVEVKLCGWKRYLKLGHTTTYIDERAYNQLLTSKKLTISRWHCNNSSSSGLSNSSMITVRLETVRGNCWWVPIDCLEVIVE